MRWWHSRWRIDRYLLGLLAPGQEVVLRTHLAGCARCRAYHDAGVLALRAARGDAEGFGAGELERMARRASAVPVPPPPARPFAAHRWMAGTAALAAAVLLLPFIPREPRTVGAVFASGGELAIDGKAVAPNDRVPGGALVNAVRGDSALLLEGQRGVLLREGARARFEKGGTEAILEAGRARFSVKPAQGSFSVLAGGARVEVRGTVFVVERRSGDETLVAVHRGEVRVSGGGSEVTLRDGQESTVTRGKPAAPARARDSSLEEDREGELVRRLRQAWTTFIHSLDGAVSE